MALYVVVHCLIGTSLCVYQHPALAVVGIGIIDWQLNRCPFDCQVEQVNHDWQNGHLSAPPAGWPLAAAGAALVVRDLRWPRFSAGGGTFVGGGGTAAQLLLPLLLLLLLLLLLPLLLLLLLLLLPLLLEPLQLPPRLLLLPLRALLPLAAAALASSLRRGPSRLSLAPLSRLPWRRSLLSAGAGVAGEPALIKRICEVAVVLPILRCSWLKMLACCAFASFLRPLLLSDSLVYCLSVPRL